MNALKDKGIILAAAVMLVVFVSIAVLGVTVFIVQRLNQFPGDETRLRCIYNAQAGIQQAIYYFRFRGLTGNGSFSLGASSIDADNSFTLSASAGELLMVNTSGANLQPTAGAVAQRFLRLEGLIMQNATDSNAITIDRMIVTWSGGGRRLNEIWIGGLRVWAGNSNTPANCNISNFTMDTTPTAYPIDYLLFDGNMSSRNISIEFVMTDASSRSLAVYPASGNYNFTVRSTGQASGSGITRMIQADYNAATSRVINYAEQ